MISKQDFAVGFGRFAIAARQPLDEETLAVYYDALGEELNTMEWHKFTMWALREEVFDWIPRLNELTAALHKWRIDQIKRLPGQVETPEEQEARQKAILERVEREAEAKRQSQTSGIDVFKRELAKHGISLDGAVKDMPK